MSASTSARRSLQDIANEMRALGEWWNGQQPRLCSRRDVERTGGELLAQAIERGAFAAGRHPVARAAIDRHVRIGRHDLAFVDAVMTIIPKAARPSSGFWFDALASVIECEAEYCDDEPSEPPKDLISTYLACNTFEVSRTTLKRRVMSGDLKSYRRSKHANATHMFSEADLAQLYPRRECTTSD